jgi:LmbE family N-acetylglucosaminyl deacetylase
MTTTPTLTTTGSPAASAAPAEGPDGSVAVVRGPVLGVWAHPDDEAFLSAGLMARVRSDGHRVVVATATRGEQGTDDPATWPPARLGRVRARELAESLAVLDVHEHRWLGHRDGTLDEVRRTTGVAQVVELLEEVRPAVVVTFGPDGMTGHADHRTVSAWVTEAWRATGRAARLWYATLTPAFHARWGELNDRVGLWFPGQQPPVVDEVDLAAEVRCDPPLLDRKHRSLRAHATQTDPLVRLVGESTFRHWWSTEWFVDAEVHARLRR